MEFTLVYDGPMKANGSVDDKQMIRRCFHSQLSILWKQFPLKAYNHRLEETPPKGESSALRKVNPFVFAPLVTEDLHLIAEVDVIFLRPEPPGSLITQGGDIDNRLKTLFDAFRMPKGTEELPAKDKPDTGENPFYCLLEDDNLITRIAVTTDRLLENTTDDSHVPLVIHVTTKRILGTWGNIGMG